MTLAAGEDGGQPLRNITLELRASQRLRRQAEEACEAAKCAHEGIAMWRADSESQASEAKGRAAQAAANTAARRTEAAQSKEAVRRARGKLLAASRLCRIVARRPKGACFVARRTAVKGVRRLLTKKRCTRNAPHLRVALRQARQGLARLSRRAASAAAEAREAEHACEAAFLSLEGCRAPEVAALERREATTSEFARLQGSDRELNLEHSQGHAIAERPRLTRRATVQPVDEPRRLSQLAGAIQMDWCVAIRPADGRPGARAMSVDDFLASAEARAVKALADERERGEFLLVCDSRWIVVGTALLDELTRPRVKVPPPRLNFFELLRASLGDPQFADVWLVPDGQRFHESVLGLDRANRIAPPQSLRKHLRPYQVKGFQWLVSLARNGLGAVLADDMGLGKTLQAIAFLLHMSQEGQLTDERGQQRPALVVVPPGLLRNWQREFLQWAPSLQVYVYHGMQRELPPRKGEGFDIFLTTYDMVRNDCRKLSDKDQAIFSCMVIDEAQAIKNHKAKRTRAVKEVGSVIGHTRIALSGTPIENKVDELHSIFDFVNYGYLGDFASFSQTFSKAIEQKRDSEQRQERLELLRRLTCPFQMRRLKTDPNILPDLPEKIDYLCSTALTAEQQRLYAAAQEEWRCRMDASRRASANHQFERRGHIFAMLENVRRICSHPLCLDRDKYPAACRDLRPAATAAASGKAARLVELLEDEILPAGQKVLIFATRKVVLRVLRMVLEARFPTVGLLEFTGELGLQERADVEQRFAMDPRVQVLLITVQCGGIGLNLTAASHVVHFDRLYNPAKEAQATDRCHRLGQRRAVCVHRMVTEGTYEERLEEIMQRKQDLSSLTVTRAEDWIADYDDQALFDLFTLRSGKGGAGRKAGAGAAVAVPPTPHTPQAGRRTRSPGSSAVKRPRF